MNRNWENDTAVPDGCDQPDIARQLIDFPYGDGIEVALGGGRANFLPKQVTDPDDESKTGKRADGRNLAEEWASDEGAEYVWSKEQFDAVDPSTTDRLLGLFGASHVEYEHDRGSGAGDEPSLTEMTEKAIDMVQEDKDGFAFMVEAGRIDHAHHGTNAYRALTDTIEFSNAIRRATAMVDLSETMIVVTADHGHVFTIAGYQDAGNPILGTAGKDVHGTPYTPSGTPTVPRPAMATTTTGTASTTGATSRSTRKASSGGLIRPRPTRPTRTTSSRRWSSSARRHTPARTSRSRRPGRCRTCSAA